MSIKKEKTTKRKSFYDSAVNKKIREYLDEQAAKKILISKLSQILPLPLVCLKKILDYGEMVIQDLILIN